MLITSEPSTVDLRPLSLLWLLIGLLIGLLASFQRGIRQEKSYPNQGIWISAKNGLKFGVIIWVILFIPTRLAFGFLLYNPNFGLSGLQSLNNGLLPPFFHTPYIFLSLDQLAFLPMLLAFSPLALLATLWFGCVCFVQHFILRTIFIISGKTPWNYSHFLDCSTDQIFLRKVGGGYIFIHRMLMEHFAEMEISKLVE